MKPYGDGIEPILVIHFGLTQAEVRVARSLVEGLARKEIGAKLGVSIHTVDTHLSSIYRKLGVRSEAQAVGKILGQLMDPSSSSVS